MQKEIQDGTVKKLHRKEILMRGLKFLIEEKGILYDGDYYKGRIGGVEANGNINIDFGIADPKIMAKAKPIADMRIFVFAKEFSEKWKRKYDGKDYIAEIDAEEFLENLK